ncbi:UDP-glucuronosyltransferase 2B19-like [Lineus longissimus]|uniref:UDP-glucuronosyltransferase 2B19-like n=1 Tax=Lineus longissimus TaxID=88925 RepID=UPI00315C8D1A
MECRYFDWKFVLFLIVVVVVLNPTASEKILILPPSAGSHLMQMNSVADGLITMGHEVFTILNSRTKFSKDILSLKVKVIEFDPGAEPVFQTRAYQEVSLAPELLSHGFFENFKYLDKMFDKLNAECRGVLSNKDLFKKLEAERFDLVVVDGVLQCLTIIPYRLGVPFGVFMAFLPLNIPHVALQSQLLFRGPVEDWIFGNSNLPPFVGKLLKIFLVGALGNSIEVYGDIANITLFELQKQTKLWLYDVSKVLDTPVPVSPNVINVGGLNVKKPKPLPAGELKQFVDTASDGFILVSFGSLIKFFPDSIVNILLDTFRDVPYKIVWKWDKTLLKNYQVLPSNVLAVNWIPQNDVLGHRNIKLFLTHCGNSGQHEALYSSVPMVGLPLFADQPFNCRRIEEHFGRHIRAKDLSKDKLLHLIKQVISDRKYSDNIKKASAIFRDQPMEPRETAAYWIDHVIKYGADHLMSTTNEMSWIQILMWDVLFVVCVVISLLLLVVFLVCRCLFRRCCRSKIVIKEKAKLS